MYFMIGIPEHPEFLHVQSDVVHDELLESGAEANELVVHTDDS